MAETNRRRPRTILRVGEIAVATGAAMAAGVGLAALAVDTAWLWPPPLELGTVAGVRVLLGSVMSMSLSFKVCTTRAIAQIIRAWPTNLPVGNTTAFQFAGFTARHSSTSAD